MIDRFVVTGYLGDHRPRLLAGAAASLRRRLAAHGATHVVAYFDENSHDDERWLLGHTITREAYTALFERLLRNEWLGLVLKPKHAATLRARLGSVAPLLEQAMATGRCHIFDELGIVPAAAALAADVAIHGHLQAATAAIEAALAGVPTLIMDFEGVPDSPLNGLSNVIFHDWTTAWDTCRAVFADGPGAVTQSWAPYLRELDPFRDGRAAERMAGYLASTLAAFRRGAGRVDALADASEQYGRMWGRDKVLPIGLLGSDELRAGCHAHVSGL